MTRKIQVSLWMIVATGATLVFLLQQLYFKPCQPQETGACNTVAYGYCCPGTNLVCYRNQCRKLSPTPP
jgi:hypothetical protein